MTTNLDNVNAVLSGGFRTGWFIPIDGDGYMMGPDGGTLVPGPNAVVGNLMVGVKTAAYKAIEPLVLTGTGEDQVQGQLVEPQQTLPAFDMVASIGDLSLDALQQSTQVVQEGNMSAGVIQPYLPNYIDGALLLWRLSISKDPLSNGGGNWDGILFPKTKAVPMSSDGMAEKKITDFKRHIIANPSSIWPNGLPLTNTTNWKTASGVSFPLTSPNKQMFVAWMGDGVTTNFLLPQSKIPGRGLLAVGYPNVTRKEGIVVTPVVTLVSTNYQFAISPAPALNSRIIAVVEYL